MKRFNKRKFFMKLKFLKILLILLPFIALAIAIQFFSIRFMPKYSGKIPRFFHRLATKALGLHVKSEGSPPGDHPALIISNHVSWADIPVLGATTEGRFVAKAEIGKWPFVGMLAKLQRTLFVERSQRSKAKDQASALNQALTAGHSVILFPEGTSHDGNVILPFKSALFGLADSGGEDFDIAPVLILYDRLNGMPLDRSEKPLIAWYGDTDFIPHAKNILKPIRFDIRVIFAPKVKFSDFPSRKEAATYCETRIKTLYRSAKCNRSVT